MTDFLHFALGLMIFLIVQSYIIYPVFIRLRVGKRKLKEYPPSESPHVSILLAAYNESSIIEDKLRNIFESDYDPAKISVYVGSDHSSDNTVDIIKKVQAEYPQIQLVDFKQRQGKPNIINSLAEKSNQEHKKDHILLLTDANVLFDPQMITYLISDLQDQSTGLVGASVNLVLEQAQQGISSTENSYNKRELTIKYDEGVLWGTMMGPFGAAYALKSQLWQPIPKDFIVDDFWVNMSILRMGWFTKMSGKAYASENIVDDANTEYRRKVRMSTGNLQNLFYFTDLLFSTRRGLSFSYWSHKVLRWLTPIFMVLIYIIIWILYLQDGELKSVLYVVHSVILLCILDFYLAKKGIYTGPLRYLRHFLMMNLAMLQGYKNYFFTQSSSIWEPTKRKTTSNVK